MHELRVEAYFSAAHHLLNYNGKCENQHGHNWKVLVYVKGETLDDSNILIDFKVLKKELNEILNRFDHQDLNELEEFKNISPSSEIISKYIYQQLKLKIPIISKVSVYETSTSCASYFED